MDQLTFVLVVRVEKHVEGRNVSDAEGLLGRSIQLPTNGWRCCVVVPASRWVGLPGASPMVVGIDILVGKSVKQGLGKGGTVSGDQVLVAKGIGQPIILVRTIVGDDHIAGDSHFGGIKE